MATTLKDGCDMDSMDRSLLDCDLLGDQLAAHPLDQRPGLSLDPGKLVGGLVGPGEPAASIPTSSGNLPDGGSCPPPSKPEEAVPEICSDFEDAPVNGGSETPRRETVVRFKSAVSSTSLVAATSLKMEQNVEGSKGERHAEAVQQVQMGHSRCYP